MVLLSIVGVFGIALVLYVDSCVLTCPWVLHVIRIVVSQEASQDVRSIAVGLIKPIDLLFIAMSLYVMALGL